MPDSLRWAFRRGGGIVRSGIQCSSDYACLGATLGSNLVGDAPERTSRQARSEQQDDPGAAHPPDFLAGEEINCKLMRCSSVRCGWLRAGRQMAFEIAEDVGVDIEARAFAFGNAVGAAGVEAHIELFSEGD
jgi:hypothetical protein